MPPLPLCELRVATPQPGTFYCRHAEIRARNNLVSAAICQMCTAVRVPCPEPRPVPTAAELQQIPSLLKQAWSVGAAVAAFVADGLQTVDAEQYAARLRVCDECSERRGGRCLQCGCFLAVKAKGRAFTCPLGKWPEGGNRT